MSEEEGVRFGHLTEAIIHFNQALDRQGHGASATEVAGLLADALNKIQTDWIVGQSEPPDGETRAFQNMILARLSPADRAALLGSDELPALVSLQPQIMNHDTLTKGRYRPDRKISVELRTRATDVHHRLVTAWDRFRQGEDPGAEQQVLRRSAELLYIVRSNIKHGEKTPFGPDLAKRNRDEQVSAVIVPLQLALIDLLLGRPSQKFACYGTLVPGGVNQQVLADVPGKWEPCRLRGSKEIRNGLPYLWWDPGAPEIDVQLFTSISLPAEWNRLDAFEGQTYKRRLVLCQAPTWRGAAYAYVASRDPL